MVSWLLDNLSLVRSRIAGAVVKTGRKPEDVDLMAVTKTASAEQMLEMLSQGGLKHLGENRVQAAEAKIPVVNASLSQKGLARPEWHLIGHLQSNKAKKAALLFDWMDSLDSLKLAEALNRECEAAGKLLKVLVEVQPQPDAGRSGIQPEALGEFLAKARLFKNLDVRGLMAIAPDEATAEAARPHFRLMKRLFDAHFPTSGAPYTLSLGMSRDFEVAIQEGATLVRVGSLLFSENS